MCHFSLLDYALISGGFHDQLVFCCDFLVLFDADGIALRALLIHKSIYSQLTPIKYSFTEREFRSIIFILFLVQREICSLASFPPKNITGYILANRHIQKIFP